MLRSLSSAVAELVEAAKRPALDALIGSGAAESVNHSPAWMISIIRLGVMMKGFDGKCLRLPLIRNELSIARATSSFCLLLFSDRSCCCYFGVDFFEAHIGVAVVRRDGAHALNGFPCIFHDVICLLGLNRERNPFAVNHRACKYVERGIRAHPEILTEEVETLFDVRIHPDCNRCLCHNFQLFVQI